MGSAQDLPKNCTLSHFEELGARVSEGSEGVMERLRRPNIVPIEGDMLPTERRDMSEQIVTDQFSIGPQFGNGVAEIDRIPEDDGGDDEIEARSPVELIFEGAVADFAKAMKEYRPGKRVACLSLVEAGVCPPPQNRIADPVEREEGALEPSYLPKRLRKRILFRVNSRAGR